MRPTIRLNASSDTGVSQTDRITRNTQLLLSGTANPNALVTIFDGSDVVGTVLALPNGSWQFETGLLDDGLHNLTAVTFTSPTVRETSAALAVTVDTTTMKPSISLAASSDSGASSTDNLTNKPNVILNGGGEVGARIEIRDGAVLLGTTTVNTLGKWQFNATNLTEGDHRLTATAIDKAGNVAQSDSLAIRVDRTLSAPSIQLQAGSDSGRSGSDFITRNTSPTVVVASEAGATVQLSINGAPALTAVAAEDGRATFQLSELPDGAYRISATATDRAGNTRTTPTLEQKILKVDTSVVASKIDLTASSDTGESATDNVTAAQDIVLNGNTEVDATVILRRDGVVIANLQADATGRWTFIDAGIPEKLGAYIYTASIFDIAGNTAQVTTGVVVDRAAPRKPTFDLPSSMDTGASTTDNVTSLTLLGNSLVLTGTAEAGRTVEIFRDGVATPIARVVSVDGTWSHGFANASGSLRPAADGTVVLRARTIDLAGNATMSDDFTLRLDSTIGPRTIDLLAASDTGISDTDNFTADRTPVFTGTAEAGARVELFIDGVNAGTVTADASGVWSLRTNELAPGAHSALARTTDVAGNTGNTSPLAFTITGDPRAPTIDLAEGSDTGLSRLDGITFGRGNPTTQQFLNPVFAGTASAGATVSVIEGGTTLGTVVANSAGRWTLQMPDGSPLLSEGQHEITAISIDRAGVTTTSGPLEITIDRSTTFNASSLSIDNSIRLSTTAFETSDADLVLRGIADEPGSLIHVLLGNVVIGFSGTGPTGSWSIPLPPLSDGLQRLKVVTTDIAGNKAGIDLSILVDSTTQAPTIDLGSSSDTGASSSDNITNRDILTLSGTAEGRSVVTIFDGDTAIGTATPRGGSATTNGAWTFSASGLAEGVHNLRVEALDAFGLRQVSDTLAVTIDRTAPGKPTLVLDAASDSGLSNTDNITNASILTLRGVAEPGVRVELLRDAPIPQVASGFATADPSGNFSFSISADRMIAAPTGFIVQAVDTAGNISRSDPLKVTIDTAGPTAGTPLLSTSSDTGISATDNLTHDTTPTFIGRTEAGARVELKIDGAIAGTAFADAAGDWSITAPGLAAGLHTAMTTITDVGGNGTDSRTRSFTIDDATVSPTIDLTASYDSGRSSTDNNTRIVDLDSSDFAPLFQGTAEALASVTVTFGGRQITTTANALGLWSVAGSQFASLVLAEGLHDVSVSATDRAGNVASGVPLQITLDSTAPARFNVLLDPASDSGAPDGAFDGGVAASYLTNDLTPTFTGVAEAFSEVRLIRNGAGSIGSTIADAQGAWSFTPANPIGSHGQSIAVDASVTDLAGNVSAAFGALIRFDTVAPNISITTPNFAATDTTPDIAGVTEAGATVEIFRSRQGEAGVRKLGETTAAADGGWQFAAPELVDGFYSFYATATDVAGNMRPSTVLFRTIEGLVVRPTIDLLPQSDSGQSSTDNVTNANVLSLSGTAAPNAAVVVQTLSGGHFVETTADSSGVWRADLGGLGEGSISIVASEGTLVAPSTNTSTPLTVTIDRTATVTAIDLGTDSDTGLSPTDNITSDATPSFFLTASEPNFLDPSRGSFGEVLIDGSGSPIALGANLSVTLPSLVDGAHFIESRLVDRAGNVSTQRLDFVIDTTTVAPTLALDAGQDTGNSATDGITRIPTMAFVGTAEPGALVQIVVEGTAADGSAVNGSFSSFFVDATGTFQRSMPQGLPDGTYVLTARATDIAGNEAVSAPFNVTLDTLTPVPTLELAPDVPTINFKGLPYVTASSFAVQGTAEAGATVTVSDGGIVLGTALAAGDGTWSFDVSGRAPGPRSLSAVAVDVAGNSAASASLAFGAALTGNAFDNLLIGTANDEVILGLGANDVLRGLAGDDLLDGGEGSDTADYSVGPTGSVTANLTLAGPQAIGGGAGADTLVSIENLIGSNFNDTLIGDAGNNVLEGGVGNDDLFGGAGLDTASYASASGAVEVKLLKNPAAGQPNGLTFFFGGGLAAGSDRLFDIENLTGSGFNDRLEGDDRDNVLSGGAGNDTLTGGAGNDVLNGGEGNDTLIGNVGNNVLNGGAGDDTILDGNDGVAATTTATTTIDAGSGDDRIEIASTVFASGSIDGGEGTDVLLGANATLTNLTLSNIEILETQALPVIGRAAQFEAFDTIRHSAADLTTRVVLTLAVSGTATTLDLVDELALAGGGNRAVLVNGTSDDETITTGAGNDTVNAGNGNDTLDGGGGNDTLNGGSGADRFVFGPGGGADTVQDFLRGTDKIDLTAYASQGIVGRVDLSFTDLGSNTRISFADGSTITLNGVSDPALLTDSDFIFGAALTPIGAFDAPGEIMPNLPFVGSDGAAINLLDTAGGARFLVLSVCAEWCTPCFGYSADLGAVAANAGPDFAFVEVLIENQDQQLSQTADALQWRDRFGLTIPVLTTDGDAQAMTNFVRGVNAAAIPLYFVIDAATGEIVDRSTGYNTVNERVRELLDISGGTHPVFGAAPVVQNDAYVVDQDQTTAIALSVLANDSDPEGNALIASLVAGPAHGSLDLYDDGTFTYTPQTGYTGSDFFTYRASDSFNFSEIGTVALTIEVPDDDPPTAIAIDGLAANIRENDPNGFVAVGQVRVIDPDVQPEFRNNPVTLSGDPRVALSGDQLFVFADAIDFDAGDTEITFTLSTGPISRTVTIPVLDQNEAPVAVDDGPFQVSPGQDLSIHVLDLLANDSDVNAGAVLEIYAVDDAVNGTVALIDDHVVFQADNIASAEGSFSYFVRDNQGGTSGATVLLNIQPFDVFL
ncbi:MAG: Ig-like domain-containing protein [Phreatobacter sp.]|uniref:Ig-like domain-containing protein n=1 Tax=Phreatobacter sp. TaxID=1966341 RepID=UPI00403607A9